MKKEVLVVMILLLLTMPAVGSLLSPGGFTSHDLTHHVIRQISMDKLLSEGQFPPRWSGELNNGFGYPVFLFNYPLPALLGEVFHKLGFNFVDSVKAVFFFSMVISVLGMYLFLRQLLGLNLAAFVGAIFYLYAPLRFINVYVAAAVGGALSLGILPFVFWSMVALSKKKRFGIIIGSASLAALILSHNVTAFIFAPVIALFAAYLIWQSQQKIRLLKNIGMMFFLGLGLSVWFWLPAVWEKQYIRFDQIYSGFYKNQFVSLAQLIHSPWGYGLSHPQNPEPGDMSYQLGLAQILVMFVLIPAVWIRRKDVGVRMIGALMIVLFAIGIFLTMKISQPVWDNLPFLSLVQFPFRFSVIALFAASVSSALVVWLVPYQKVVAMLLIILVIYANRNHWQINQVFNPPEDYYQNLKTTSTTYGEDLPKWGRVMDQPSAAKLQFVKGGGHIGTRIDKSNSVLAEVDASSAAEVRLNQFYFPTWQIKVDGQKVGFNYLESGVSFGMPTFEVPKGRHLVLAEFKNTGDRNLADTISLVSVVVWLILLCKWLLRIP